MALTSPGVEVVINDQSQYLPAPSGSIPLVILATAQNKADASGTAVALATTAANAGKLYNITSQRDLVNLYGTPFFYNTTNGTPIQGYELNEYGLLAAYSLLGVTNQCYVLRADVDLASLIGKTGRPTGAPTDGTVWLDTTTTAWGIFAFNRTTGKFTNQVPIVITDPANLTAGIPNASLGNMGQYAVNAIPIDTAPTSAAQYFYKTTSNVWVAVGSTSWRNDIPTVQGTNAPVSLTVGNTLTIQLGSYNVATIVVGATNTVDNFASLINGLKWTNLKASVVEGKLSLYNTQPQQNSLRAITIVSGTSQLLTDLGLTTGVYAQPQMAFGTSAEMPLWTTGQATPAPTGSVWIKTGSAGNGLNPIVAKYNTAIAAWVNHNVTLAADDWEMSSVLDSTGGQSIPAGSIYGQYDFGGAVACAPVYLWERIATGPTIVTGNLIIVPSTFAAGPYYLQVQTSLPNSTSLSAPYNVTIPDNATAAQFVTAWYAAGIPYVGASVTTDGRLQLVHTLGGEILLNDCLNASFARVGASNGVITSAGFTIGATDGCKFGTGYQVSYYGIPSTAISGTGTGGTVNINYRYGKYALTGYGAGGGGTLYAVGDQVKVLGTDIGGASPANDLVLTVTDVTLGVPGAYAYYSGTGVNVYTTLLSNWREFTYTANEGQPVAVPVNNTNWFYSVTDEVDIMVQKGGAWVGYALTNYDSSGHPQTGVNNTDPLGPIISASTPTLNHSGFALSYGDLWIDTSDLENYPVINRWQSVDGVDQWMLIDNTDQVGSSGVLFADARWANSGTVSPTDDPITTIPTLLLSSYLDLDAPQATLYPQGMLLFNTRRSGYNVKQFRLNYFSNMSFPGETLPVQTDSWVTVSGNTSNGSPYMGRKAQRAMVVQAMNAVVSTNTAIRDEDNAFNLMAAPNYPELQPGMVVLNADRGETGYIIGDTPMRLPDDATQIQAWATNAAGAVTTGEDGCVTRNTYLGLFYPSGITTDLSGNLVAVPSSHMMLRTFLHNDNVAYPWLAAAGTRRGNIDNATNIGYLNAATGEFQTIKTRIGIRDVLYTNFINPMVFFTGVGLLNYGNKTSYNSSSALDRVNVARLVAYIRRQLTLAARPFVFEPNDALTRNQIAGVVQTLMVDLVAKRGLFDYLVVCDESNNTPARIDRNELWIDVAVEPVKAAEFIYIPVRIANTGELSGK